MKQLTVLLLLLFFLTTSQVLGQSAQLAASYYDNAQYEKALPLYRKLYKQDRDNVFLFERLVVCLQQENELKEAIRLLEERYRKEPYKTNYIVQAGVLYKTMGNEGRSRKSFESALQAVDQNPKLARATGMAFREYQELDYALECYKRAMKKEFDPRFYLDIAGVYADKGDLEGMFSNYLLLAEKDPGYTFQIQHYLNRSLANNPAGKQLLLTYLLRKAQEGNNVLYSEMLVWYYQMEGDFPTALVYAKGLFMRKIWTDGRFLAFLQEAFQAAYLDPASQGAATLLQQGESSLYKERAMDLMLRIDQKKYERAPSEEAMEDLLKDYRRYIALHKQNPNALRHKLNYARLWAVDKGAQRESLDYLDSMLIQTRLKNKERAEVLIAIGDISVYYEEHYTALMKYAEAEEVGKRSEQEEIARYKSAKAAFYRGEFQWAEHQLNVLQQNTSRLTANDAIALSVLIHDNAGLDSLSGELTLYARADFLGAMRKFIPAQDLLDSLLRSRPGHEIQDEALFLSAGFYEYTGEYEAAIARYEELLEKHPLDILSDKALFRLAALYLQKQKRPDKAIACYERILFVFPDSILLMEAREKYRELRGDQEKLM